MYNSTPYIFQIYHEDRLDLCPVKIRENVSTWVDNNPLFNHVYISFKEAYLFILDEYGKHTFNNVFLKLPNRAAKSDFIRYALLYKYGGLYVDIDDTCNNSIIDLIDQSKASFVLNETGAYLNATFIFSPSNNQVFKNTLNEGIELFQKLNHDTPHFQMGVFGPYGITRNVMNYYQIDSLSEKTPAVNIFNYKSIENIITINYGSQKLTDVEGYESWTGKSGLQEDTAVIFRNLWRYPSMLQE